jgi:2-dehydropantoate 2-reductase
MLSRRSALPCPAIDGVPGHPQPKRMRFGDLMNLGNAVGALVTDGSDTAEVVATVRREGEYVLRHAGIAFTLCGSEAARSDGPTPRQVPGFTQHGTNSTWQSLTRQTGNVETDFFNGEIVRLAHRHGITAPANFALARLARQAGRDGLGPGRYTATQLAALLDPDLGAEL